jgi:hypothetical protein
MQNFRIKLLGLAGTALLFSGLANAQFTCSTSFGSGANGLGLTAGLSEVLVRNEGLTELITPTTISCNSGANGIPAGTTATLELLVNGASVTSKTLQVTNNATTIEAAAVVTTAAMGGAGAPASVTVLGNPAPTGNGVIFTVALPTVMGAFVANTSGDAFTISFTNIRINATTLAASAQVSETLIIPNSPNVTTAVLGATNVALAEQGLSTPKASTDGGPNPQKTTFGATTVCNAFTVQTTGSSPAPNTPNMFITVGEAFSTAFKVQGGNSSQTLTASTVGVFSSASPVGPWESGDFVASGSTNNIANSGTRVAITFANIPAGLSLYMPVQLASTNYTATAPGTGILTMTSSASGTFSAVPYITGQSNISSLTPNTTSVTPPTLAQQEAWFGNLGTAGATVGGAPGLALVNPGGAGTATVYYEATSVNPIQIEVWAVPVWFLASGGAITPTTTAMTVQATLAPISVTTNFPDFIVGAESTNLNLNSFAACNTTLLFPYVTNGTGFDTGLAIINASEDNLGTGTSLGKSTATNQTGTCTLYFYGGGGTLLNSTTSTTGLAFYGTANAGGAAGSATSGYVFPAGGGAANLLSALDAGFTGYIIASCNFQYAHGYAYIINGASNFNGPTGTVANYLAVVLPTSTGSRSSTGDVAAGALTAGGFELGGH